MTQDALVELETAARLTAMYRSLSVEEQDQFLANNGLTRSANGGEGDVNRLVVSPSSNANNNQRYRIRANEALRLVEVDNSMLDSYKGSRMIATTTLPRTEEDIRIWFDTLDVDHSGSLDKNEFKNLFATMEDFGTPKREKWLNERLAKMNSVSKDRLAFDEFFVIVSHLLME